MGGLGRIGLALMLTLTLLLGGFGGVGLPGATQASGHAQGSAHSQVMAGHGMPTNDAGARHHASVAAAPCCASIEAPDRIVLARSTPGAPVVWPMPGADTRIARALTPEPRPPRSLL